MNRWVLRVGFLAVVISAAVCLLALKRVHGGYGDTTYRDSSMKVEISDNSGSLAVMRENRFTVTIMDAQNRPISDAKLRMTLSMPDMFCGQFPADITETKPGVYTASGILVMRGDWQAKLMIGTGAKETVVIHRFKVS